MPALTLFLALTGPAHAGVTGALLFEAPTLHSPIVQYADNLEHPLPISLGGRAELGVGVTQQERWLVLGLAGRSAAFDMGRVHNLAIDLAWRAAFADGERLHPHWEAGLGLEDIELHDDGELLIRQLGPRFFGGLGLGFGAGRLRPVVGVRAGFTAVTGSAELPAQLDEDGEQIGLGPLYMPAALVLAGTLGLQF